MTTGSFQRQFVIDCRQGCGAAQDRVAAYSWLLVSRTAVPPTLTEFHTGLGAQM